MDRFKASNYNMFVKMEKSGQYVVYNTLNDSIALINREAQDILKPGRKYSGPTKDVQGLIDSGMLINASLKELDVIKYRYYATKYDMSRLIFIIVPTYSCNLKCPYCFQGSSRSTQTMSDSMANTVIKFIQNMINNYHPIKVTAILYGGEPLLYPKRCTSLLKSIWDITQSQNIDYHGKIITNGTLFSRELISELIPYLSGVQVTFDGPKSVHDKRRVWKNGNPSYDQILNSLKLLEEAHISTSVRINIDKENYSTITEILDDFVSKGLNKAKHISPYWGRILCSTRFCNSYAPYCLHDEEWTHLVKKLWAELFDRGFTYIADNVMTENYPATCKSMSPSTYSIMPNADLYNCLGFVGDQIHSIGHLDSSGVPVLNYRFYKMMERNPFRIKKCVNCVYLPRCGGGCTALAYKEHGSYSSMKCPMGEEKMKASLKFHLESKYPDLFGNKNVSTSGRDFYHKT